MKSKVKTLDEIKSVRLQPCKAGFHRESDFIHQRWISPVEDGFDCVFSVKDNTLMRDVLSGEFKNTAKCEHRICPDKCSMG